MHTPVIDCGSNGQFNEQTGTCRCVEGWSGSTCTIKNCGETGHYNYTSQKCECNLGYTGSYCNECGGAPDGKVFMCAGPKGEFEDYHLTILDKKLGFIYNGKTVGGTFMFSPKGNAKFDCACNLKIFKNTDSEEEDGMTRSDARIDRCQENARATALRVARAITTTAQQNQDAADVAPRDAAIAVIAWGVALTALSIICIGFYTIWVSS